MKTYEEMAQNALNRIHNHECQKATQRKNVVGIVKPAMSIFLIAVVGVGIFQTGLFKSDQDNHKKTNDTGDKEYSAENTDNNISTEPIKQEQTEIIETTDKIVINELNENPILDRMNIALFCDDFVKMDKNELNEYYGQNIFPDIPNDLTSWDEAEDFAGYGIYRREKGSGEVYYDTVVLNYSNVDFSRNLNIEVAKNAIPFQDFVVGSTEYQESVIAGKDVIIGFDVIQELYFIGFMNNNVGYSIVSSGLSQDEIVDVIRSLVTE